MTMLPLHGALASAAGVSLSQTAGSETERTQSDTVAQRRGLDAEKHAEQSAGIGQTEQDQETSDRDADGRRHWERRDEAGTKLPNDSARPVSETDSNLRQSKDPTGQSGVNLDLTG